MFPAPPFSGRAASDRASSVGRPQSYHSRGGPGLRGPLILGLVLILSACGETYTQRAERIRTGVLGLSGRDIINCMGPPEDLDYESELHGLWVYVRPLDLPMDDLAEIGAGRPGVEPSILGRPGDRTRDSNLRTHRDREREFLLSPTTGRIAPGYCLLKFEVDEDVVSGFEARGRSHQGLNADSRCAQVARYCLE